MLSFFAKLLGFRSRNPSISPVEKRAAENIRNREADDFDRLFANGGKRSALSPLKPRRYTRVELYGKHKGR